MPPLAPGFPLCSQNGLSPSGPHSPRALIHFSTACLSEIGAAPATPVPGGPPPVADCTEGSRHSPPPPASSACHSPARRGRGRGNYPENAGKNSHGATARSFFFFKGSDVTVWWQESYPVSFPSSHNNPAPENLPPRAQNISLHHVKMRAKPLGAGLTPCVQNESR